VKGERRRRGNIIIEREREKRARCDGMLRRAAAARRGQQHSRPGLHAACEFASSKLQKSRTQAFKSHLFQFLFLFFCS